MGNQLDNGTYTQELHLQDLGSEITLNKNLGKGRILKSLQCSSEEDGLIVVLFTFK
jgi:hypothetical protein